MKAGIPEFTSERQPCVICCDETKFAIKSICCGAGAACSDCIHDNYLSNSTKCMFCNTDTAKTFLYNPVLWKRTMLSFKVMLKHSNRMFMLHIALLLWRTWYMCLFGAFLWSVMILILKYIVDGGIQDMFDIFSEAVESLEIEKTYPNRWK